MNASGTIFLTISALIYTIITTFLFLSKKKIDKLENRLFGDLLWITIISMATELMIVFTKDITNVGSFIQKLFLVCILLWLYKFMNYAFVVIAFDKNKSESENLKKHRKLYYIFLIINILCALAVMLSPIYFNDIGTAKYTSGPSVNIVFSVASIYMVILFSLLVIHIKEINKKGNVPIIALIILLTLTAIIQNINPEILLSNAIFGLIICLMYNTIENPDMKLLEEIHKSKEISDSANEEKTLFLYNMTQEIRNINKKIDDDADIILDSKDWIETYESARDIKSLTSKFNTMTNEILDVSQINSSNIKVYNSKYNIKNILKHIVNIYTDICKDKELKFITNIEHNIPEILYGDSIGLKEILTIILDNSTKYTEKGYIEFNVNTIIKNDICRLIITIEDSGTGISSENINKIKIDKNSLSKANELTTLMNGTMIISSDYGKGTKIKIILDQKMELIENEEVSKYKKIFDNLEILAIDDSESGHKIIDKLLKDTKIKIDKAINGKESINKIKINKYDVILLDEELSQISGTELIKKIKEIRNFNTPIILLTKDNSYEYNEEHLKLGFNDYILKPLKKDNLLDKINKYTKKDN